MQLSEEVSFRERKRIKKGAEVRERERNENASKKERGLSELTC